MEKELKFEDLFGIKTTTEEELEEITKDGEIIDWNKCVDFLFN